MFHSCSVFNIDESKGEEVPVQGPCMAQNFLNVM